jgi:hypothetical protein
MVFHQARVVLVIEVYSTKGIVLVVYSTRQGYCFSGLFKQARPIVLVVYSTKGIVLRIHYRNA